jgi:hypothetical protein
MSAADLMTVLPTRHLRYDWDNPGEPGNDHLIFSKGHASPLLYAMFEATGAISDDELVTGFAGSAPGCRATDPGATLGRCGHRVGRWTRPPTRSATSPRSST